MTNSYILTSLTTTCSLYLSLLLFLFFPIFIIFVCVLFAQYMTFNTSVRLHDQTITVIYSCDISYMFNYQIFQLYEFNTDSLICDNGICFTLNIYRILTNCIQECLHIHTVNAFKG